MEVIVVDGGSTDETADRVLKFKQQHPEVRVNLLENPGRIFSTGFNIGLKHARGDAIVLVGGHTTFSADYIETCVHYLQTTDVDCVAGVTRAHGADPIADTIALAMSTPFGVGGVAFRVAQNRQVREVDTAAYGVYKRRVFEKLGGLDEELVRNQDDEFNYRLRESGGKILLVPTIYADYNSRGTLSRLWSQYYQYGYWKVRVMQKHPFQMRPRQFVPPLFALGVLVGVVLALLNKSLRRLWYAGLAAYALVNIAASVNLARANGWERLKRLPLVFFILHFSYGLGFLGGFVHFRDRWNR